MSPLVVLNGTVNVTGSEGGELFLVVDGDLVVKRVVLADVGGLGGLEVLACSTMLCDSVGSSTTVSVAGTTSWCSASTLGGGLLADVAAVLMSSFTGASVTTVTSLVSDRGCRELLGEGKDMVTPADDAAADGDGVIDVTVVKAGDITLSSGDNSAERVTLAFDTRLLSPKALEEGEDKVFVWSRGPKMAECSASLSLETK